MLRYVDDTDPGITRRGIGRTWAYFDAAGRRIGRCREIDRLDAIALPPAYSQAWFCPSAKGHIQATGWDDKCRKQYRYHPEFRAAQDAAKYGRCLDFGRALPAIRAKVQRDLGGRTLGRDRVIAAVVRLLDAGYVRIGNEGYAKANRSFGATTLRRRHAAVTGDRLRLEYRAKSGKIQRLTINDARLSRLVRRCQDLSGQHLSNISMPMAPPSPSRQATSTIISAKPPAAISPPSISAPGGASVIAFSALAAAGGALSIKAMLEPVAAALGNTPAIARKSYVHPALVELAGNRDVSEIAGLNLPRRTKYLSSAERGLIAFLEELAHQSEPEPKAA